MPSDLREALEKLVAKLETIMANRSFRLGLYYGRRSYEKELHDAKKALAAHPDVPALTDAQTKEAAWRASRETIAEAPAVAEARSDTIAYTPRPAADVAFEPPEFPQAAEARQCNFTRTVSVLGAIEHCQKRVGHSGFHQFVEPPATPQPTASEEAQREVKTQSQRAKEPAPAMRCEGFVQRWDAELCSRCDTKHEPTVSTAPDDELERDYGSYRNRERDLWMSKRLPSGMYEPPPSMRVLLEGKLDKRAIEILWNDITDFVEYRIAAARTSKEG